MVQVADFDHEILLRFLAKVAHGYAVARYGVDAFDHLLPSLILTRDIPGKPTTRCFPDVIGGDGNPPKPLVDAWFLIDHETVIVQSTQQQFAAVTFKLFPMLPNVPHYLVVAGPLRDPKAGVHGLSREQRSHPPQSRAPAL